MHVTCGHTQIIMVDVIIAAILKAEEQASREISEAAVEADKIREESGGSHDDIFNKIVDSCKKEAEQSRQQAKQRAAERVKKIMSECDSEVAKLRALDQKTLMKAVEMVLKEVTSGGAKP